MSTAIIGTGGIGSAIARLLTAGGEAVRLSSPDTGSAQALAAELGDSAVVAAGNHDALQGAGAAILALRFTVLKSVIDELGRSLAGQVVIVPSNPLTTDGQGNLRRLLPDGQSSGEVVAGWLPPETHLAMAFGSMSAEVLASASHRAPEPAVLFYATDDDEAGWKTGQLVRVAGFEPVRIGGLSHTSRLEVGGDLHDQVLSPAAAAALTG